jgi:MFS family permease
MGDQFFLVALPWVVLSMQRSVSGLAVVMGTYGTARLLALAGAGVIADRYGARSSMLLADAVRVVLVATLAVALGVGGLSLVTLILLAAPIGLGEGLFLPGSFSIMPQILPEKNVQAGNGLNEAALQVSGAVGPALGGILVRSLGASIAVGIDAASFVVSAISLLMMRVKPGHLVERGTGNGMAGDSSPGQQSADAAKIGVVGFMRSSAFIRLLVVFTFAANLAFGAIFEVALPVLARSRFSIGATAYGIMLASFGAGALAGSLASGRLSRLKRRGAWGLGMVVIEGVTLGVVGLGGLIVASAALFLTGAANGASNVLFTTLVQQGVPGHLLGRLMSILLMAGYGSLPIAAFASGIIASHFGVKAVMLICGAMLVVIGAYGASRWEFRSA